MVSFIHRHCQHKDRTIISGYRIYIISDSLPSVKSDLGIFADNRIIVRISRENGSRVFNKSNDASSFGIQHCNNSFKWGSEVQHWQLVLARYLQLLYI